MKKIFLLFAFIFAFFSSFAQPVVNRASAANTVQDARLMAQYNLFIPRYLDTNSVNLGVDSCGAIIFTYVNNAIWKRSCNPKRWELVGNNTIPTLQQVLTAGNVATTQIVAGGGIGMGGTNITNIGDLRFSLGSGGTLQTASTSSNRTWTLPNASGTLALTSDIVDSVNKVGYLNFSIGGINAPSAGDSVFVQTTFVNKHVRVYREGEYQHNSTSYGIETDSTIGQIIFHPPFSTGERISIEVVDTTNVKYLVLESSGYDPDAEAYFDAVPGLSLTFKNAYNAFVIGLKEDGLYEKFEGKAIWPLAGSTLSTQKWNSVIPLDNDASYRLTFPNSATPSADGLSFNGTNQYARTHMGANELPNNQRTLIFVMNEKDQRSLGDYWMAGVFNGTRVFGLQLRNQDATNTFVIGLNNLIATGSTTWNNNGIYIITITGSPGSETGAVYYNGEAITTNLTGFAGVTEALEIYFGGLNLNGTPNLFTQAGLSFMAATDQGFSQSEAQDFTARLIIFLTAISRPPNLNDYRFLTFNNFENLAGFEGDSFTNVPIQSTVALVGSNPARSQRDASVLSDANGVAMLVGGYYWMVTSAVDYGDFSVGPDFSLSRSTDLKNWTYVAAIGDVGGTHVYWSPKFYYEDGHYYVTCSDSDDGTVTHFPVWFEITNLFTGAFTGPNLITGTAIPANTIDMFLMKVESTYYMWYKNEATAYLGYATSSSMFSGYNTGTGDISSIGSPVEGVQVIPYDGLYYVYYSKYTAGTGVHWRTSSDLINWSAETRLNNSYLVNNGCILKK